MNLSKGLQRVSAVFWGLCGLFFLVLAFNQQDVKASDLLQLAGVLAGLFALHWLTCWIVRGFFGNDT